jgi:hypothetical protein
MSKPNGLKKEWYDKPKSERGRKNKGPQFTITTYGGKNIASGLVWEIEKTLISHGSIFERVPHTIYDYISSNDIDEVLRLIGSGIDPNGKHETGISPFVFACRYGRADMVGAMIKAGADVNYGSGRSIPFSSVYESGDYDCMRLLLENGAKILPRECTIVECDCGCREPIKTYTIGGETIYDIYDEMEAIIEEYELMRSVSPAKKEQQERNNSI